MSASPVNLRDLKYFVAIADFQHFGKAAKACFISQPSLSIQIKKLENRLGVQLLERTSRSVLLTDIGKVVAEQARELLQRATSIEQIAKSAQDPFSGQLNLGVIPTLTSYLLPHVMPALSKTESFPKLSIYMAEQQSDSLLLNLKQGKLDAVILSLPVMDKDIDIEPLFEEELMLAVSQKHPLVKKKIIKFSDLKNDNLILLEHGHCLRDQVLGFCNGMNIQYSNKFSAAGLEVLRYMVCFDAGVTIMPRLACKPDDRLCYLSFTKPKPTRTIAIAWRSTTVKKLLLTKLVSHIKKLMSNHSGIKVQK